MPRNSFPSFLVGMPIDLPNVYSLYADEAKGVRQLAAELIRLGHRGFLFLGGREHSFPAVQRLSGLRRAVAGVPHCRVEVEFSGYSLRAERRGALPTGQERRLARVVHGDCVRERPRRHGRTIGTA